MKYTVPEEAFGNPALKLDGEFEDDICRAASIISKFTGIDKLKLQYFIEYFGLATVLNNPSIITGITGKQKKKVKELEYLLLNGGKPSGADDAI